MKKIAVVLAFTLAAVCSHADTVTSNLLVNPGAEAGSISGWTAFGSPAVENGTFDPGLNPNSGNYDFVGNVEGEMSGSTSLMQSVSILTQGVTAAEIDAGLVTANIDFFEQSLDQNRGTSFGQVTMNFLDADGRITGSAYVSSEVASTGAWHEVSSSLPVPVDTTRIVYEMYFQTGGARANDGRIDAFIDDNSLTLTNAGASGPSTTTPEPGSLTSLGTGILTVISTVRRRRLIG